MPGVSQGSADELRFAGGLAGDRRAGRGGGGAGEGAVDARARAVAGLARGAGRVEDCGLTGRGACDGPPRPVREHHSMATYDSTSKLSLLRKLSLVRTKWRRLLSIFCSL